MNAARAIDAHALAARWHVRNVGLWMFLGTVVMLFAAVTSAMVVRASASDWRSVDLPAALWLNTALIIASSAILERARRRGVRCRTTAVSVAAATVLGIAFLVGQIVAWGELMRAGLYLPTNPSSSFLYLFTGIHAVHVIAALVALGYLFFRTVRRPDADEWPYLANAVSTFWHFLAATWLYLFVILQFA